MDLAELKAARDRLKAARASGVRSVGFGEDKVDFYSDGEMAAAIASVEADIAKLERGQGPRTFYPRTSKGL